MDAESYNKRGDDFFDAGKYTRPATAYQQSNQAARCYADAYLNLGETYFNATAVMTMPSRPTIKRSLEADWADAYRALGIAYLHKIIRRCDHGAQARERIEFLPTLKHETRWAWLYYDQGAAAYNANNYEEAIGRYHEAISFKADSAEAYSNLGDAYRQLNKLAEAGGRVQACGRDQTGPAGNLQQPLSGVRQTRPLSGSS